MSNLQSTEQPVAVNVPHEDRKFLHTVQAGIGVPLLQSLATAVIVGIAVMTVALVSNVLDPWKPTVVLMALAMAGWWLYSLWRWTRLTERELPKVQVQSVDDDGDPLTPKVVRVQLDWITDAGHYQQTSIFDLPATEQQLGELAEGLLNGGRSFSEKEWCGAGHPFSVNGFRELRSEMIKRGLLTRKSAKDHRQGYELTEEGKAIFRQFLS
jgi:hypothetical protein